MDVVGQILDAKSMASLSLEPTTTTTMTDENGTTTTTIFNVPTIDGSSLLNAFPSGTPHGLVIATGPDGSDTVYIDPSQFVFTTAPGEATPEDDGDQSTTTVTYVPLENAHASIDVLPPVGKGPHHCQLCTKIFPKWNQLQRHLKTHADDKTFGCSECDASFNIESNLVLHKATHNPECSVCPECGKRFSRTASLRAHIMIHEKEENLFCTECGDEFPTQSKLDRHLKRHREDVTGDEHNYGCKQCSQVFSRAATFRDHMKTHYRIKASLSRRTFKRNVDRSLFAHKCSSCEKSFQKPSQLSRHTRIHTGERPFGCVQCGKSFNQKGALLIHQKKHSGEKPHKCEFCPAAFSQKGNLRAHIRRVHAIAARDVGSGGVIVDGQTTLYRCERCACAFRKLGSLNAHMSRMHSSEVSAIVKGDESSPNNGKTVNDVIKQIIQLSEHSKTSDGNKKSPGKHSTDDILQQALQNSGLTSVQSGQGGGNAKKPAEEGGGPATSVCNADQCTSSIVAYADSATGAVKRHVVKRVGGVRVHQCVYCTKVFKKPSDLVRHIRIHTREKPYKCSQCFRSFTVKSTLTSHVRTHTGVKEFGCEVCEKMFATHGSLRVHMRLHTGVKPFSCPHCVKTFRTSGHRKSHMMTHRMTNANGEGSRKGRLRRVALPDEERREKTPAGTRRATRRISLRSSSSSILSEVPLLEPILITETGFVQVAPRGRRAFGELFAEPPASHRPYRCGFCSQAFKKSSHLKQHVRSHTGEKPFKCQLCYRGFVSSGVLKAHLRTHSGVKSHQCHVCNSAFTTKGSLKRHMSTHSEIRPFMCPYCQKTFKTTVNCKKHMKTHKQELKSQMARRTDVGENAVQPLADNLRKDRLIDDVTVQDTQQDQQQQEQQADSVVEMGTQDQNMTLSETLSHLQQSLNQLNQQLDVQLVESDLVGVEEVKTLQVHAFDQHAFEQFSAALNADASLPSTQCTLDITGLDAEVTLSGHELLVDHRVSNHDGGGDVNNLGVDLGGVCLVGGGDDNEPSDVERDVSAVTDGLVDSTTGDVVSLEDQEHEDDDDGDDDDDENDDQSKRIHKCTFCDRAFKRLSHLKQHASVHTGERPFKCPQCSHMFVSASALKGHFRTHLGSKDFKCHVCRAVFTTNGSLRRHMVVHSTAKPYKCVHCNETFRTQVLVKRHLKLHTNDMDYRLTTTTATASPTSTVIDSTSATVPRKRPDQKKPENAKTSPPQTARTPGSTPKKRIRPPVLQFTDEQTSNLARQTPDDFASVSEKMLIASAVERDRLSESRTKDMPMTTTTITTMTTTTSESTCGNKHVHQCVHCPKSFKKPSDLSRHLRIHTGERPFQCDLCHKTFTVKSTLDSHLKTHSGKKHCFCHVCNSLFATKGSLKVHMRLHTGAKPFKCSVCEQRFRTSGHRKSHMMMHLKGTTSPTQRKKGKSTQRSWNSRQILLKTGVVETTTTSVMPPPALQQQQQLEPSLTPAAAAAALQPDSQSLETTDQQVENSVVDDEVNMNSVNDVIVAADDANNLVTYGNQIGGVDGGGVFQLESLSAINGDGMPNITVSLEGLTADQLISADGMHLQGLQTIQIDASILQQLQQQGNVNITLDASLLTQGLTMESALLDGMSTVTTNTSSSSNIVLQPMAITLPLINEAGRSSSSSTMTTTTTTYQLPSISSAYDGSTEVSLSINEAGEMVTTVAKVLDDQLLPLGSIPLDQVVDQKEEIAAKKKQRSFTCDVCSKSFKRFAYLKEHLTTHWPKSDVGEDVGGGAGGGATVRVDLQPPPPPPMNRGCQVCGKVFSKPSQLERHLRIHTGERPFVCSVCDRAFNQKNALTIHMKKHTGERPHVCFFCGQLFAQKGNLRVHVRRVHSKDMAVVADEDGGEDEGAAAAANGSTQIVGSSSEPQMDSDLAAHQSRDSIDLQLANFLTELPSTHVHTN